MPTPRVYPTTTLQLLDLPFAFSQVPLLTSSEFRKEAKLWDQPVKLEDLQQLHQLGLLVPFYRADDDALAELAATTHPDDYSRVAHYASEGKLRDPAQDSDPTRWPHLRPDGTPNGWWDGYLYSKWQLLALRDAITARHNLRYVPDIAGSSRDFAAALRHEHLALAALSTRLYPSIVGQIRLSDGLERESLFAARHDIDAAARLAAAAFPPDRLRIAAEHLLGRAHSRDPLRGWWDLVRHSDHSGWFRLRGGALEAIWQRIAAVVTWKDAP